jgi:hypothetical protein
VHSFSLLIHIILSYKRKAIGEKTIIDYACMPTFNKNKDINFKSDNNNYNDNNYNNHFQSNNSQKRKFGDDLTNNSNFKRHKNKKSRFATYQKSNNSNSYSYNNNTSAYNSHNSSFSNTDKDWENGSKTLNQKYFEIFCVPNSGKNNSQRDRTNNFDERNSYGPGKRKFSDENNNDNNNNSFWNRNHHNQNFNIRENNDRMVDRNNNNDGFRYQNRERSKDNWNQTRNYDINLSNENDYDGKRTGQLENSWNKRINKTDVNSESDSSSKKLKINEEDLDWD